MTDNEIARGASGMALSYEHASPAIESKPNTLHALPRENRSQGSAISGRNWHVFTHR
jgi:hypothetical protein